MQPLNLPASMSIMEFQEHLPQMMEQAVRYNEPVSVLTKDGAAVVMSEEEYRGLLETLYLLSVPGMKETLAEGLDASEDDCLTEDEVRW